MKFAWCSRSPCAYPLSSEAGLYELITINSEPVVKHGAFKYSQIILKLQMNVFHGFWCWYIQSVFDSTETLDLWSFILLLTYIAFEVCVCVCVCFMVIYILHINSQDWNTIMLLKWILKVCVKFEKVLLRFLAMKQIYASSVSREK